MKGEKKMEKLKKTMEYLTNIGFTKLSAKPVVIYNNGETIVQGNITIDFCLNEKMANALAKKYNIPAEHNRFNMAYFSVMINENKNVIVREKGLVLDSIFRKSFKNFDYWDIKNKIESVEETLETIIYTSIAAL